MKLYSFVHSYLSDVQKGLQTAHMAVIMARKYASTESTNPDAPYDGDPVGMFNQWADHARTLIILEGGNSTHLNRLKEKFTFRNYPYGFFNEDKDSLNESITAVGIVLPSIFDHTGGRKHVVNSGHDGSFDVYMANLLLKSKKV